MACALGLNAAATFINLFSAFVIAWTAMRAGSPAVAVASGAACLLYIGRAGPVLTSAWNPHVIVLPMMAAMVVWAAAECGDCRT